MMSGRWLRIAPDDSSTPLQTMSYWNALMVSGSCVFSASSPPCGMLNGLWLKSICPVSSFSSYIGKSVIQQKRNAPFSHQAEFRRRAACAPRRRISPPSSALPAAKNTASPGVQAAGGADRLGAVRLQVARDRPLRRRPRRRRCSRGRRRPRPAPSRSACRRSCAAAPPRPAPGSRAPRRPRRRCARTGRSPSRRSARVTSADPQRIAQVRLVGAVFQHRRVVGDARERRRRHRAALGEFLEHAGDHRLDRRRTRPPA